MTSNSQNQGKNENPAIQGRPIILGEALFDQFPDGEAVLGGAPFNVAWHLKGLGASPLFISRIGKDGAGEKVRAAMQDWDMDLAGLQEDPNHPTGAVRITLDKGQPTFDIMPDQAYDHIDAGEARSVLAGAGDAGLLYHGTLILRSAAMRDGLDALLTGSRLPIFVDINLRAPWWDPAHLPGLLERARWVKVNDDELAIITGSVPGRELADMARYVQTTHDIRLLIVTRGAKGAVAFDETGREFSVSPEPSGDAIVDTVGAGDAFSAMTITGLLNGWPIPVIMDKAQAFASRVCRLRGAVSLDPDFYPTS
uniref:Fructokinase n=1 Tax=Candidatus Kentrum sp. DK TaxID=2126562 RepID=A0A450T0F9_9GAMM|nr:MAG: fructokinase [Candidatus Kentron sp. DK]